MSIAPLDVPDDLKAIDDAYTAAGHRQWLVGGYVRDHIMGTKAKDLDLATTATPDQQVAICEAAGLRWFGTGLQHGTLTVLAGGEPREITTLRTDVACDGRHAEVEWTRDIVRDLARRDLTVNAIAMTLDGEIVDPFDGVRDCMERRIRFVGDAATRIREDHLRIMRWFRFLGRFGEGVDFVPSDLDAIRAGASQLAAISVERIWSEMSRIVVGPQTYGVVQHMHQFEVLDAIGVPHGDLDGLSAAARHCSDPAFVMAAWQDAEAVTILQRWKASRAEIDAAAFAANRLAMRYEMPDAKTDLVDGVDRATVLSILRTLGKGHIAKEIADWIPPSMPVTGRDLIASGMRPGVDMGRRLDAMRQAWIDSDFTMGRDELMERVA